MEILQFGFNAMTWIVGILSACFVLAIIDTAIVEPFCRKHPEWFGKDYKRFGVMVLAIMLISSTAFAEVGVPLTPEQVYEMQGGENQIADAFGGTEIYGSPGWLEKKAHLDKYEYKNEQGQSVWYGDGATGEVMTKEEFLKQTRNGYDRLDAETVQSLAEHQQYLSEVDDPDHITLNGIQLLRDLRKSIRTQRVKVQKEIAKTVPVKEYKKAQVLISG